MAPPNKLNLKDKVEDGELDLSMSDLQEVPVKEIAQAKKANKLDLSNNRLVTLPKNFATLTHIVHLDLSNNKLKELPDNFGNLRQLKHLDLYNNQLKHLPLSFSQLKSLKWLDIKKNPLMPALAQVAGPCLDAQQCQQSAKRVVEFLAKMQVKVDDEINRRNSPKIKDTDTTNSTNANQKQKQKEQKKNKKDTKPDKQASKTNVTTAKNARNHVEKQATKAKKAKPAKKRKQSYAASVMWKFLTLVLIAFITLPILSYLHQEHVVKNTPEYQFVYEQVERVWNVTVGVMPTTVIEYGTKVAEFVRPVTNYVSTTSVIIFEQISDIRHSEQYKSVKLHAQQLLESLFYKIIDLFRNIGSKSEQSTTNQ